MTENRTKEIPPEEAFLWSIGGKEECQIECQ